MTRQNMKNSRPSGRRERKRTAGVGRSVEGAREARAAGRGVSQMSSTSTSVQRADVYSRVTAEIISAIEQGAGEWRAPWFHNGTSIARPTNVSSGKRYRGINTLALWAAGFAAGYGDGLWGTYKQWQDAGAQVREGERSTTVVLWREIQVSRQTDNEDDDDGRRRMFARAFSVFNVAQVDGYARPATPMLAEAERLAHAEAFIANLGIKTEFGRSEPITARRSIPYSCRRSLRSATPRHTMESGCTRTVTLVVPSTGSAVIFPGALDRLLMPLRNAAWRFSAGSFWRIWASPTIHVPIMPHT